MKGGTRKGGPDRDRAYWEPSRSTIGRIEARVEEIEADDPQPGPPPERIRRARWSLQRHGPAFVVGLGVIAVLVAVTMTGTSRRPEPTPSPAQATATSDIAQATVEPTPLASPSDMPTAESVFSPTPAPTPDPTPAPTPEWTPDPTPAPTDPPQPTPTPLPVSRGWPVAFAGTPDPAIGPVAVGPDGTVYIPGLPGLDASGHSRTGWLRLPGGDYGEPVAFGSDGTIYVVPEDVADASQPASTQSTMLYAFAPNGRLRDGWPIELDGQPTFEAGPSGKLYVFSDVDVTVTVLTASGKTVATWPLGPTDSYWCADVIRPDGTLFYAYSTSRGDHCTVAAYSPAGTRLTKSPERDWDALTMAPDGTVVAVGYDMEPYDTSVVARTRLAVIGTDGRPAAGWPVYLEGSASAPSFGLDGTMYVSQSGLGTAPSKVVAFDKAGIVKQGWPATLPVGFGPFSGDSAGKPMPPALGNDGTVYLAATDSHWKGSVLAFDPSGSILPGWPYVLPQPFAELDGGGVVGADRENPGPVFVPTPTGGLLYLALDGEAVALDRDGKVASGWPYMLLGTDEDGCHWEQMAAMSDGGLLVVESNAVDATGLANMIVLRLTSVGKLVR